MLTHSFRPPEARLLLDRGTRGRNHPFHSWSFVANSLLRSTAGVAAARASRSNQSFRQGPRPLSLRRDRSTARPPLALVRRGRASKASFNIDGILVLPTSSFPDCSCPFLFWASGCLRPVM